MDIEWLYYVPVIGYFRTEPIDPVAVKELGVDIAIMGAIDRVRALSGGRPRLRLLFANSNELSDTAQFVYELSSKPVVASPRDYSLLRDFFGVDEVALTLATATRPTI